jgi:hypothetical protein
MENHCNKNDQKNGHKIAEENNKEKYKTQN